MEKLKLYLAHPFPSRQYMRNWELRIEEKLNVEFYNPFYDTKEAREDVIEDGKCENGRLYTGNAAEIVVRDLRAMRDSMGVAVILDGNEKYGTVMEIVYGCLFQKPVYIICTTGHSQHYWLQYHAQKIFSTLREFEKWLKKGIR